MKLTAEKKKELLKTLQSRFEKNRSRHPKLTWDIVEKRLSAHESKMSALYAMESSEGEPDVVDFDTKSGELVFMDCSAETPKGRRSLCYDQQALESRKEHKPAGSSMQMAQDMGVEILTEEQYRQLQKLGAFDLKTSSWVQTPAAIRKLGGALFCDRRYDQVFVYHNGAESYYGVRAFRACLRV